MLSWVNGGEEETRYTEWGGEEMDGVWREKQGKGGKIRWRGRRKSVERKEKVMNE